MSIADTKILEAQILDENRRVHALEDAQYLERHPEQTNFYQSKILKSSLKAFCERLSSHPQPHVLDVGCGTGYLFIPLLMAGCRMTGVDISKEMIHALKSSVPKHKQGLVDLNCNDIEGFIRKDTTHYEGIVISALLHHLYDYESILKSLCDRLALGGILLIFFEPLKQNISSGWRFKLHRTLGKLDERFYRQVMKARNIALFEEDYELSDYQRKFGGINPCNVRSILKSQGMEILGMEKYCARRFGLSAWVANHIVNSQNTFNLLCRRPLK